MFALTRRPPLFACPSPPTPFEGVFPAGFPYEIAPNSVVDAPFELVPPDVKLSGNEYLRVAEKDAAGNLVNRGLLQVLRQPLLGRVLFRTLAILKPTGPCAYGERLVSVACQCTRDERLLRFLKLTGNRTYSAINESREVCANLSLDAIPAKYSLTFESQVSDFVLESLSSYPFVNLVWIPQPGEMQPIISEECYILTPK